MRTVWFTHEQGFHPRYHQDNTIKPQQLEDCQPRVRWGGSDGGDLDDGRSDSQNKIQPVRPLSEEVPPVWEVGREPRNDFDVKCEGDHELAGVKEFAVHWTWINCAGCLYRQRGECQDDPKPLGHLIVVFEFIPSSRDEATVDYTKILVMFPVDIDHQAGRKSSINA